MKRIENLLSKKRTYCNIDGTKSDVNKRVGFCNNNLHKGYLTKKLMEEHQCIERGCHYFIKYEKNAYWQQKNASKEKRQKAKIEKKFWEQKEQGALYLMRELTKDIEFFGITSAYRKESHIEIRYVSLNMVNLSSEIYDLKRILKVDVKLAAVKTSYEKKIELLDMFNPSVPGYFKDVSTFEYLEAPIMKEREIECLCTVNLKNNETVDIIIEDSDLDFNMEDYEELNPKEIMT